MGRGVTGCPVVKSNVLNELGRNANAYAVHAKPLCEKDVVPAKEDFRTSGYEPVHVNHYQRITSTAYACRLDVRSCRIGDLRNQVDVGTKLLTPQPTRQQALVNDARHEHSRGAVEADARDVFLLHPLKAFVIVELRVGSLRMPLRYAQAVERFSSSGSRLHDRHDSDLLISSSRFYDAVEISHGEDSQVL